MKKTAIITLLAALLVSAIILCSAQTGATGSTEWVAPMTTTTPATEQPGESTAEETSAPIGTESGEAESTYTGISAVNATSTPAAPTSVMAAQSASPTPAANIAYAPPPATAAQMTTTIGYVPPPTAATTTEPNTVLYTKGNYEWLGTTQPTTTATTTTRVTSTTTTTTIRPPTTTTTTTAAPATSVQAGSDYEAMGQAAYQDEAIRALNALRAERGLPPLTVNATLMTNSLAQAQRMMAAGQEFHSTVNLPGCESVCRVPTNFPAKLLGETLGKHVPQFLTDSRTSVGIAIIRQGNYLYAVMQGS